MNAMNTEEKIESKTESFDELEREFLESHTRVITVRMDGLQHQQIMAAARDSMLSMNKYCLSKLIPGWVDPEIERKKQRAEKRRQRLEVTRKRRQEREEKLNQSTANKN